MRRIVRIHNSVCEHCDEGKTKAETIQGIVACTTCGAEDPNFVPLISESDSLRDAYKRRGGTEKIHIFEHSRNREDAKHREYARTTKESKETPRDVVSRPPSEPSVAESESEDFGCDDSDSN